MDSSKLRRETYREGIVSTPQIGPHQNHPNTRCDAQKDQPCPKIGVVAQKQPTEGKEQ